MRIPKDDAVLVVVDVQERLFPHIAEHEELEKKVTTLIKGASLLGIPIVVTEQYVKGLGQTIPTVAKALEGVERIEKMAFSCCDQPEFMASLVKLNRKHIILCGIETHVCVLQTALDLLEQNLNPVVVRDAVSSRFISDKESALLRMQHEGVTPTSVESILFELTRVSGTDTFKAISKLVK